MLVVILAMRQTVNKGAYPLNLYMTRLNLRQSGLPQNDSLLVVQGDQSKFTTGSSQGSDSITMSIEGNPVGTNTGIKIKQTQTFQSPA